MPDRMELKCPVCANGYSINRRTYLNNTKRIFPCALCRDKARKEKAAKRHKENNAETRAKRHKYLAGDSTIIALKEAREHKTIKGKAGVRTCLKCDRTFVSPDRIAFRLCSACREGNKREIELTGILRGII